ncbi:flagella synthesis protein FlgN [Thioalkalivibrio sp. ALE31]|uniref:flagella synthesis protein FlgN n=1 Tax=Thioalkalivibrio sp. ALE31 TaxID=1158182 RepID=UPI00037456B3|nr:flagellar protein FlgN [Thioalkalivibrio sp. ALE31]
MNTDTRHRLLRSLETSIRLAHQLEEALIQETRAVEARTPETLQEVVATKQGLLQDLETETRQQRAIAEAASESFTPEGMARLLSRMDDGAVLNDHWQALRQSIERCNSLNQGNARLIDRDRQRVELSMQILRGEEAGPAATYDPYGRTRPNTRGGRRITQA